MVKRIKKKSRKNIVGKSPQKNSLLSILSNIKFSDSYTNLILGAIMVLIAGILFVSFAKVNRNNQVGSITDASSVEDSSVSSTYTVNAGDDLWTISENVYQDGYKWVEIAKANNLDNPGLIHVGNKLIIPSIAVDLSQKVVSQKQTINSEIQSNSITGSKYIVVSGDNLWDIAVRAYGDGFRWPEIAKANSLVNPGVIHSGNVFIIPR